MTSSDSLDTPRQRANLAFLSSGADFVFGDAAALPAPPTVLAALRPGDAGVLDCLDGGLTARVLQVEISGMRYAVKQARRECRVRNDDGATSFLNELQRHAELAKLDAAGTSLPGTSRPLFGSLCDGVVVSRWIGGGPLCTVQERPVSQLIEAACALAEHGFFEWDYAPGNVLDDGHAIWLFDFGYLYRFDPLRQINTAGDGVSFPQFHPVERTESRNLFAALLSTEQGLGLPAALTDFAEADLMDGDVTVAVSHSTVNFKDGLALTGRSPVVRAPPSPPRSA